MPVPASETTETAAASPGPTVSRPALAPDLRADAAVKIVLQPLLEVLETRESSLRTDQDPEHLHGFRVAVRRSRALLSQLKRVFPAHVVEWFRQEYRWLGQTSGRLRDLDVFLERLAREQEALPAARRASVGRLAAELRSEREAARSRMIKALDSARYRALKRSAREFLLLPTPERSAPKDARRPIREVAAACLRRTYERVRATGREVGSSTPVGLLHELRIACKKLRYLLDAFACLFPEDDIRPARKRLRCLQDRLGEIHDCEVQGQALSAWREGLADDAADGELMLALGCLEERNRRRQKKARKRLRKHLDAFCGPGNRKRVRRLVKGP